MKWLSPTGSETLHPIDGQPCLYIGVSFKESETREGGHFLPGITWVYALIDTGAQWNLVDERLVKENNSPSLESLRNEGVTGSEMITNHAVAFFLRGEPDSMIHSTGAGTVDLSRRKVPWRVILGRKFLQLCHFSYDGTQGIRELTFAEHPLAL